MRDYQVCGMYGAWASTGLVAVVEPSDLLARSVLLPVRVAHFRTKVSDVAAGPAAADVGVAAAADADRLAEVAEHGRTIRGVVKHVAAGEGQRMGERRQGGDKGGREGGMERGMERREGSKRVGA